MGSFVRLAIPPPISSKRNNSSTVGNQLTYPDNVSNPRKTFNYLPNEVYSKYLLICFELPGFKLL